jgi:hypothetical protein
MSTHPMLGDTCYIHHVEEPGPGFLRCFECGHLYRTEQELVEDNYRTDVELDLSAERLPADKIFACAHCGHDL